MLTSLAFGKSPRVASLRSIVMNIVDVNTITKSTEWAASTLKELKGLGLNSLSKREVGILAV